MAGGSEETRSTPARQVKPVKKFLESMAGRSQYFCCEYDDDRATLYIADAEHKSGEIEIAGTLAALRGVASFKDEDGPGFIYVFPAISGGDPEALLKIGRGASDFLPVGDPSPDVLYFVNEAEEFIETMLEDDD
jgi:hypothetical protein